MKPAYPLFRAGRIALSPWARDGIGAAQLTELNTRCAELDVVVSTVKRRDGSWMIRVRQERDVTSLVGRGPVAAVIAGALDDWAAR